MRAARVFLAAVAVTLASSSGVAGAQTAPTTTPTTAPTINPTAPVVPVPCGGPFEPACVPQQPGSNGPTGGLIGGVNTVGGALSCATNPFDCMARGMLGWAAGSVKDVNTIVANGLNKPDLGSAQYRTLYGKMEWVGILVGFAAFVLFQVGNRTNRARLMSTARLAVAAAAMPIVPRLVEIGYGLMGEAASVISSGFGGDLKTTTDGLSKALSNLGSMSTGIVFVLTVFVFGASILVFFDLVLLAVVVSILVAFLPIFAAAATHEAMIGPLKRVLVTLTGSVAAGFVIAAVGAVGAALTAAGGPDTVVSLLTGAVALFLVGVAPFLLIAVVGVTVGIRRRDVAAPVAAGAAAAAKTLAVVA